MGKKRNKESGESFFLVANLAKKAVEIVMPLIKIALKRGIFKRKCLSICVLNPKTGEVIYTENIGENNTKHNFSKIARSKAKISWRAKADTLIVRERRVWSFEKGETVYQGGVYFRGYTVGVSGVESWYDEMIAYCIAATLHALCRNELEKEGDIEFL